MEKKKLFVVCSSHLDREWYVSYEQTRIYIDGVINRVLDILARQPDYRFMLDGQTSVLEDYLEIYPEREEEIARFQEETGMDFVVVTSDEPQEDGEQYRVADEFYIHGNFGLDSEDSGVLYYIDMYNRYQYIYTRGQMIDYLTGSRIDAATGGSQSLLAQGDYVGAVEEIMERVRGYLRDGIPEGQYRYDILTGEILTARKKALTTAEAAVCAAVAAAAGLAFVTLVKRSYRLKGSTYSYNFRENCDLTITGRVDDYIRTTTTQARKPDPPRSSGGGGYHGGGSGVHTSVGGGHHGGGGGHF